MATSYVIDDRERDTIIAALRFWQRCGQAYANAGENEIADNDHETPLSLEEIDALIEENLNA